MKSQRSEATQINNLPDDILCKILSLLPDTKHIFRTSILSHKWLNLCTQLPHFHFDFNIVNYDNATAIDHAHSFLHFADKVISRSAASNFQTFALHYVNYDGTHLFRINDWIQTALSRNVVHLDVKLLFLCWVLDDRAKIGLWLLGCDKLEVLKIKLSGVSLRVGSCCRFSNLKKLYVELERVNNELTSKMFTWLPKLEELSIIIGYFVDPRSELNIVGPVLKVLVFQVTDEMQFSDLSVVVCAPMLERVLVRDDSLYLYTFRDVLLNVEAEINVGTTYKGEECGDSGRGIELIRGFSSAKSLSISRCTMKAKSIAYADNLPVFHNLTKLELYVDHSLWNCFLNFVRCAPNLEVLVLQMGHMEGEENFNMPLTCPMMHLKEVQINGDEKIQGLQLLESIMNNAKLLKKFTVNSVELL